LVIEGFLSSRDEEIDSPISSIQYRLVALFIALGDDNVAAPRPRFPGCEKHVQLGSAGQKRLLKRPVISDDAAII
jgi:hypothetical protein